MEDPLTLYSSLNTTSLPTALHPTNNSAVTDLVTNATVKPFSVFHGCEENVSGILFDLSVQTFNVFLGLPANILVMVILVRNRKEPSSSDIFLGCLAFMDAYFGIMVPFSYLNIYYWHSKDVWSALMFSFGVKDTSGPLFLSCICLDRFVAVLFPLSYGQLKDTKYRVSLSAVVLGLTFTYASAKTIGGLHNFEKVFTGTILATFGWMVLCNGAILVALKRSSGSGKDDMHPMKKKAFKMVMSVLSIIVFNYLPPVALFPFEDHYPPDTFRCLVQPVGYAFVNISSSIQPIIYLSRLEKIPFLPEAWNKWGSSSSKVKDKEVKVETISPA
ncbi:G-protein coupled receptor 183-like [Oncorhynchus mykiss]|uniref:G-protein coupled receptor 183-like n=1 Tax=Oncorhynchus mykiss TaxID=8022 RepID=UPI001877AB92|nr:G-protein coupled receptor 183-like [Oncorhynchus mykiss]